MSTLLGLRIYGPCSADDLSARTGRSAYRVRCALYCLIRAGLAARSRDGYDITPAGRARLERAQRSNQAAAAASSDERATDEDRWEC